MRVAPKIELAAEERGCLERLARGACHLRQRGKDTLRGNDGASLDTPNGLERLA